MSNLNQQQFASHAGGEAPRDHAPRNGAGKHAYQGKHRITGATKGAPVIGSKMHGSKVEGYTEVHPSRQTPVRKYAMGKHEKQYGTENDPYR